MQLNCCIIIYDDDFENKSHTKQRMLRKFGYSECLRWIFFSHKTFESDSEQTLQHFLSMPGNPGFHINNMCNTNVIHVYSWKILKFWMPTTQWEMCALAYVYLWLFRNIVCAYEWIAICEYRSISREDDFQVDKYVYRKYSNNITNNKNITEAFAIPHEIYYLNSRPISAKIYWIFLLRM